MHKKILFPVDESENTKRAFTYVIDMAKKYDSEVLIIHAYHLTEDFFSLIGSKDPEFESKIVDKLVEQSNNIVNPFKEELEKKGIKVNTEIVQGNIHEEIVKVSNEQNCNLIIIASRGKRDFKSILIGSTSNYVIHHSKCPTLVIH